MEHWESLCPGGLSFVYDDDLFRPGTDSFLLGSFPRLRPGLRVCDLAAARACWDRCCSSGSDSCLSPGWSCYRRPSGWRSGPPWKTA